jgi:hypothetical protein
MTSYIPSLKTTILCVTQASFYAVTHYAYAQSVIAWSLKTKALDGVATVIGLMSIYTSMYLDVVAIGLCIVGSCCRVSDGQGTRAR